MAAATLNPYTQAILNCLAQFTEEPTELDAKNAQFLANMIQGRFLQYLVNRLINHYKIHSSKIEKKLTMVFMSLLSDKFFNVFRERVKAEPRIVYEIAKAIAKHDSGAQKSKSKADWLYLMICKRYFGYQNFQIIIDWLNTTPEVEKVIFLGQVENSFKDSSLIRAFEYIVDNDKDGITPKLFRRYLDKEKKTRLKNLIESGDWRIEAEFAAKESAHRIALQKYIDQI